MFLTSQEMCTVLAVRVTFIIEIYKVIDYDMYETQYHQQPNDKNVYT